MFSFLVFFFIFINSSSLSASFEEIRNIASQKPFVIENKTASELVDDFLHDSDVNEGWNDNGNFFVAVGNAYYADNNIKQNKNFLSIRALKSFEANITAKGQIISYIRTNISAEDIISLPSTGLSTNFDTDKLKIQNELEKKVVKYKNAIQNHEKISKPILSDYFSKISISVLLIEPLSNFIKKIDLNFFPEKKRKSKELLNIEKEILGLQNKINKLKKTAVSLQKKLQQENKSSIETFSSMKLVGAFQVAHFESYIGGQYEIATILMWSPKNEHRILSLLRGEDFNLEPSSTSLNDYVKSTNWASVIGGRKFIDDKGEFHLIGVGTSQLIGKSSADMRISKGNSEMNAQKELVIALKGDVELKRIAKSKLQEFKKNDDFIENQVAASFSENISRKLKNFQIQGTSRKYSKVLKHPLTNQDMYVSVYSLSVSNVKQAKIIDDLNYKAISSQKETNSTSKENKKNLNKNINKLKMSLTKTNTLSSKIDNSAKSKFVTISVNVTGIGSSKKDSIKDGLLQAISQVNGLQMSSEATSLIKSFETAENDVQKFYSQTSFKEKIKRVTKGTIQSWKIIGDPKLIEKFYETLLTVKVSKFQLSSELKRMKFVVSPVKYNPQIKDLLLMKAFSNTFNKNLRTMLVKSNKFGILDRNNLSQVNEELKLISTKNFKIEELAKIGNKVGADYFIISNVKNLKTENVIEKLAGEKIKVSKFLIDLDINIIDVATTQIIFSENKSLVFYGNKISSLAKIISNRISKIIIDTFYPARVISINGDEIISDQGKSFFNKKTLYTLNQLGKKIIDQTSGKISGRVEKKVGILNFLFGTDSQSNFGIKNLKIEKSSIKDNGSFIIRPIFNKLPSAKDIATIEIKKIRAKNQNLKQMIEKDKDW